MNHGARIRLLILALFGLFSLVAPSGVRADAKADFNRLQKTFFQHFRAKQAVEAEKTARQLRQIADGPLRGDFDIQANALSCQAIAYSLSGRYREAEQLRLQELRIREDVLNREDSMLIACVGGLANLYMLQGRYKEAEPLYLRALEIAEKDGDFLGRWLSTAALGYFYLQAGRYAEAEHLFKKIERTARGNPVIRLMNNHAADGADLMAGVYTSMAILYSRQARSAEAEYYYEQALATWEKHRHATDPMVVAGRHNLAGCYVRRRRYDEAERMLKQCLATKETHPNLTPAGQRGLAATLGSLGVLYANLNRHQEAAAYYQRGLDILRKVLRSEHPDIALAHFNLARCHEAEGDLGQAEAEVNLAIPMFDALAVSSSRWCWECYSLRARVRRRTGKLADAAADLRKAMKVTEGIYELASGNEQNQSNAFSRFHDAYEEMLQLQLELSDLEAAFDAMERSRARGLLSQMRQLGADVLAGVPSEEARRMRQQLGEASTRVTGLRGRLRSFDTFQASEDQKHAIADLSRKLTAARWDYDEAYSEIRNASRIYRLTPRQDEVSAGLPRLQRWLAGQDTLVLEYLLGEEGGFLLAIPSDSPPELVPLTVTAQHASSLRVEAGPLTADRFTAIMEAEDGSWLNGQLQGGAASSGNDTAQKRLAALWQLLVPEKQRQAIRAGQYRRLVVLPDSALSKLPFEVLVVEPGETPVYLLDQDISILYAPSAVTLLQLTERRNEPTRSVRAPVLTIGGCLYDGPGEPASASVLADLASNARYTRRGGSLKPLPFSKTETQWVADVFQQGRQPVAHLRGSLATEANIRFNATNRKVLHFACHGLVDRTHGNLFGALALTPGRKTADPSNDGFLTLAEIYELNLDGCELAILSACETNSGPTQRGEGTWALSRGFLVAGARRVVASNWLVDDQAAASLVSYFCSIIAKAEAAGEKPDYAEALWKAKRWVRNHPDHPEWRHPYYWGTFVLVGPN